METIVVKENKVPLIVGGICTAFFSLILCVSIIDQIETRDIAGIVLCTVVFGGFLFLGVALLCSYFLRRLVVANDECFYQTSFGKKTSFMFHDIDKYVINLKNYNCQYKIYNRQGNYLGSFESNMLGSTQLISFFKDKRIPFENNTKFNFLEKISQSPNEEVQNEEIEKIKKHFVQDKINIIKKRLKIVQVINVVILLIAFFMFSMRDEFIVFMLTPLFWYGIYLYVYPIMVFEMKTNTKKKWKKVHVEMPFLPVGFSVVGLVLQSKISNIQDGIKLFIFIVGFATVLFIAFVYVGQKRDHHIKKRKWLSVYFALLVYTFSSSYAWNWVCRINEPIHESVIIVDKLISHSKYNNDYELKVRLEDGTIAGVEASSSLYHMVEKTDIIQLCKRESVFKIEYWHAHL